MPHSISTKDHLHYKNGPKITLEVLSTSKTNDSSSLKMAMRRVINDGGSLAAALVFPMSKMVSTRNILILNTCVLHQVWEVASTGMAKKGSEQVLVRTTGIHVLK